MNKKILKILAMYALVMGLKKEFEEFDSSCSNDPCEEEYISQYSRSKLKDNLNDVSDALWALLGIVSKFDLRNLFTAVDEDMVRLEGKEAEDE